VRRTHRSQRLHFTARPKRASDRIAPVKCIHSKTIGTCAICAALALGPVSHFLNECHQEGVFAAACAIDPGPPFDDHQREPDSTPIQPTVIAVGTPSQMPPGQWIDTLPQEYRQANGSFVSQATPLALLASSLDQRR